MHKRAIWLAALTVILVWGAILGWRLTRQRDEIALDHTVVSKTDPGLPPPPPAPVLQSAPVAPPFTPMTPPRPSITPPPAQEPPLVATKLQPRPWPYAPPPPPEQWATLDASQRLSDTRARLLPKLKSELALRGFKPGNAAFIRVFKESNELELWLRPGAGGFLLFQNYRIACYSGTLGPKTAEGDMQAPEGFYAFSKSQLNPASRYHLSFNIGYPNEFDRSQKRTGSLIMIHGSDVSIGCFAMTDPVIEEIYLIVEAALNAGQGTVPVHAFPFRMSAQRMEKARIAGEPWTAFWQILKTGHDIFEKTRVPPTVAVTDGRMVIEEAL